MPKANNGKVYVASHISPATKRKLDALREKAGRSLSREIEKGLEQWTINEPDPDPRAKAKR